jgi:putative tryptophan/tyrosine transport system substrate-binding protein
MRRREFIAGLGGAAAWPEVVRAQRGEGVRHIGVLLPLREDDPYQKATLSAFNRGLAELGWNSGRNLRMDVRYVANDLDRVRLYAKELVGLQPDVILADSTPQTAALQRETRTIPIVFVAVSDPVGSGFVANLPRPGGNITGFSNQDSTLAGKWVELLTEIAPGRNRVAAMFNPDTAPFVRSYYLPAFEAATRYFKVEPIVAAVRSDAEIETAIASLGREPGGSLVLMPDAFVTDHRVLITGVAARHNLPTISQSSSIPRDGGLLSYGPDFADLRYRAAAYVDRILRGAKPADLAVQLPVKFEMVVNAKIAKALGIEIPAKVLALADEVIE